MKGARRSCTISEACRPDGIVYTFEAPRHQHAVHDRNHGTEVTEHRQETFLGPATVNIPIPATHGTERRTEAGPNAIKDAFPKGETAGEIPDQGRKHIPLSKRYPYRSAQGFLTASEVDTTENFARTIEAGHLLIQNPGE